MTPSAMSHAQIMAAATPVLTASRIEPWDDPYGDVPQQLKDIPNWVRYALESNKKGQLTKIPKQLDGKANARANDSSTWTTFEHVCGFDKIGFEFKGTDVVGIDLDGCVRADNTIEPFALAIMTILPPNTYVEFSPSGTGLHAWLQYAGALPEGKRKMSSGGSHSGPEIYHGREGGRFFTISGQRYAGSDVPTLTGEQTDLLYFLLSQWADQKFMHLWLGKFDHDDPSKADYALMCELARLTQGDREKMERYFSASALGQRDKWTDREDYRARTIDAVLKDTNSGKNAPNDPKPSSEEIVPMSGTAADIEPKKIVWLWPNRFAQKLNMIVGNPDCGKGLITHYVTACVTAGRDWFDTPNPHPPSDVLVLTGEEDWDDTVVPRLMAAGADLHRVHWLKLSVTKNMTTRQREIQLDRDVEQLEAFLVAHPNIRVVIIDPISSYMGRTSMIDEQKVRGDVLMPLKELANRRAITIIGVMHLNKKVELDAIHRIGGAMAFVGVARMVWLCAPKPNDDGTDSDDMLMVKVKGNIVHRKLTGLAYYVTAKPVLIEGDQVVTPYVQWNGTVDATANQVTGKKTQAAHRPAEQLPAAEQWLRDYLRAGPKSQKDVEDQGIHGKDFSKDTLKRAKKALGVRSYQQERQWFWELSTIEEGSL